MRSLSLILCAVGVSVSVAAQATEIGECRREQERLRLHSEQLLNERGHQFYYADTYHRITANMCDAVERGLFEDTDYVLRFVVELARLFPTDRTELQPEWQSAFHVCARDETVSAVRCPVSMAVAHLRADLPRVLGKLGCGASADWELSFDMAIAPGIDLRRQFEATRDWFHSPLLLLDLPVLQEWITGIWRESVRSAQDCAAGPGTEALDGPTGPPPPPPAGVWRTDVGS